jgi:hypothetical protein
MNKRWLYGRQCAESFARWLRPPSFRRLYIYDVSLGRGRNQERGSISIQFGLELFDDTVHRVIAPERIVVR